MQIINDYWKDFSEQEQGSKPVDKIEMELSAGTWTDVTDYYIGGATFNQEKERAPDKISGGDTRYVFDNTEDTFTPSDSGSIFYGIKYHGKKIKFSLGFYGLGYLEQSRMIIKDVKFDYDEQRCYIFCQEISQRLVDEDLNTFPTGLIPVANAGNTGNGVMSEVATLPFATVSNGWTVTCDDVTNGGPGTFDVVKDGVGSIGTATMGTEFSDATHGIKFTITEGGTPFIIGDEFTFTAVQHPEWTTTNLAKILWSIFTGYGYDSETQDAWSAAVFDFDHTKSDDNTDINYLSFVQAVADIDNDLTGYIPYDKNAAQAVEEIIIHSLGSIYTDRKGRISLSSYKPSFGITPLLHEFSDDKWVLGMDADEDTAKIINKVTVRCKRSASWSWSNASETTDDIYSNSNATSISDYGLRNPFTWTDYYWYSPNRAAQEWLADRIIDKYGLPPTEIEFETGLDAIRTNLADKIFFTDARTSYSKKLLEVIEVDKDFESTPKVINLIVSNVGTTGLQWCFLGSSAEEGDGISPQASDFDSATDSDKQFCYLSTTGSSIQPLYYLN